MREADARAVLLARAFEETDAEGRLLSTHERARATAQAREATAGAASASDGAGAPRGQGEAIDGDRHGPAAEAAHEAFVVARAGALLDAVREREPRLVGVLAGSLAGSAWKPLALIGALVLGWSSQALGPEQRINLLALPILGVLLWNAAVYLWVIVNALRRPAATRRAGPALRRGEEPGGMLGWLLRQAFRLPRPDVRAEAATAGRAAQRYAELARPVLMPLFAARARRWLHLCAAVLAVGMAVDMYVRGLVLAYQATWQSTFLEAGQVQAWLGFLLGPASKLTGIALPAVAPLEMPAAGDAAPWIHLFAVTLALWVIVPRTLLAWWESHRIATLAADVPLDVSADAGDPYFRRLAAREEGRARRVVVLPYAAAPEPRRRDALTALLHDVFGTRAEIAVSATTSYGDDAPLTAGGGHAARAGDTPGGAGRGTTGGGVHGASSGTGGGGAGAGRARVALFALGQLPEAEVHAHWLAELRDDCGPGDELLVLVDGGRFAADMPAERVDERRRAWERVVREAGLVAAHVDLSRPPGGDALDAACAALWPPDRGGDGTSAP